MRYFIYSMQSGGASVFCFWLSQLEDSIGVTDMYRRGGTVNGKNVGEGEFFLKATVNEESSLQEHIDRFRPHKQILYLRNPFQVYESLRNKRYNSHLEFKFNTMDTIVYDQINAFDLVVTYEDFINKKEDTVQRLLAQGIPANIDNYKFRRSFKSLVEFNKRHCQLLMKSYGRRWGSGNIHSNLNPLVEVVKSVSDEASEHVNAWCPNWVKFYEDRI